MGWTVLYIAFGIVALWLLGEVLLQYKARLRWRLLAFVGFLGVVVGVLMPSIWVIGAGAATFAVGQTYVTLSFRRGFSTGWAIGGSPGASRRRKVEGLDAQDPTLQVSDLEYDAAYAPDPAAAQPFQNPAAAQPFPDETQPFPAAQGPDFPGAAPEFGAGGPQGFTAPEPPQQAPVYAPEPLPDETGQYGVYQDSSFPPPPAAAPAGPGDFGYDAYGTGGFDQNAPHDQQNYAYDNQQQYAAYSDPYIGSQAGYGEYDTYAGQQAQPGYDAAYQDPYAAGYPSDTPPGGVWVPQQRTGDELQGGADLPPEQPYPYENQGGYDAGYNEQQPYRY
ncbi:hypothetical protein [Streptomyces cavernicola]|uniref:Uncharacterized protein n=1 Tax=Streptomyces cavernicola TaxID=3043613 RepID=A0ABT6S4L3_9ACTN|nr:hypothetical protein [Streptomyces sp. B-S-A6]MDI3403036.1 hypothetical protein [Streptomyces sp. B-S-A6]